MSVAFLRYAAFTDTPGGGNPAGIVLEASGLGDAEMLALAADVGYSETAFLVPAGATAPGEPRTFDVRYFSPRIEVPFCGHATIASAVALAERDGPGALLFRTPAGSVPVATRAGADGRVIATLTSVVPYVEDADPDLVDGIMRALRWDMGELDRSLPVRIAFAGARHIVLAAAARERLARLDYAFDDLRALMADADLTTVDLVWREAPLVFHARNPFPVGGVVEDPATGAAAAAFGAYLRAVGLVTPPAQVVVLQGADMGRPGRLLVDLDAGRDEVRVSGGAVRIGE
jgi:PhzF family phenazine biosynthesis protein